MTDLDELRRALRAQEALAPDAGEVLTVATRRIRRRRTMSVAAVTLAVAALGAGTVAVLNGGAPAGPSAGTAVTPASALSDASAGEQVPPAAPPVSLEDSSWQLALWSVQPHFAGLHYGQDHKYAFEIDVRDGTAPKDALPAKPTTAGQLPHPQSVRWQDGPGRWIWVRTSKPVTAEQMLALLGKIVTKPPVLDSPLKSVHVPDGLKVVTFTSEPVANTLVLCPDADAVKAPLDSRCFSLFITTTDRASDTVSPEDPLPVHQHRAIGTYTVEIDSSAAGKQAALEVLNSVQLSR